MFLFHLLALAASSRWSFQQEQATSNFNFRANTPNIVIGNGSRINISSGCDSSSHITSNGGLSRIEYGLSFCSGKLVLDGYRLYLAEEDVKAYVYQGNSQWRELMIGDQLQDGTQVLVMPADTLQIRGDLSSIMARMASAQLQAFFFICPRAATVYQANS